MEFYTNNKVIQQEAPSWPFSTEEQILQEFQTAEHSCASFFSKEPDITYVSWPTVSDAFKSALKTALLDYTSFLLPLAKEVFGSNTGKAGDAEGTLASAARQAADIAGDLMQSMDGLDLEHLGRDVLPFIYTNYASPISRHNGVCLSGFKLWEDSPPDVFVAAIQLANTFHMLVMDLVESKEVKAFMSDLVAVSAQGLSLWDQDHLKAVMVGYLQATLEQLETAFQRSGDALLTESKQRSQHVYGVIVHTGALVLTSTMRLLCGTWINVLLHTGASS